MSIDLAANLQKVQQRIDSACAHASRDPRSITLLAVTKSQSPEAITQAADLGLNLFGENRVQEAKTKIAMCSGRLHWHMIGHLQSNKCRDAVQLFEMIESVDSLDLAREIDKWADKVAKTMPVLFEVNIAGEATKYGFKPEQLLAEIQELNKLPRIEIHGLMTIAPWTPESEKVRPVFRRLRELKADCEQKLGAPLTHLSMGMSGDFEVAIQEGSTLIRIGTALFGPRISSPHRA